MCPVSQEDWEQTKHRGQTKRVSYAVGNMCRENAVRVHGHL